MKEVSLRSTQVKLVILLNIVAMGILAFFFFDAPGTTDVKYFWMRWLTEIEKSGMQQAYWDLRTDYPPLFFVLFALGDWLRSALHVSMSDFMLVKTCLVFLYALFLVVSSVIFSAYSSKNIYHAINFSVLNLVIFHNAIALGYFDVLNLIFLGLAFIFYQKRKYYPCVLFLLISLLFKWQPLVLLVPFFFLLVRFLKERKLSLDFRWVALYTLIVAAIAIVFHPLAIWHSLQHAMNHRLLSANASNMYWILTLFYNVSFLASGEINHIYVSNDLLALLFKLPVLIVFVLLCVQFFKQSTAVTTRYIIFYMYIFYFAFFLFNIGIHENHAVPLAFVAWIISMTEPSFRIKATMLLILAFLNQFMFYGWQGYKPDIPPTVWNLITLCLSLGFFTVFLQSVSVNFKKIFSPYLLMVRLPSEKRETGMINSVNPA